MIEEVRNKANEKYNFYVTNTLKQISDDEKEMWELIIDLLKDDNCFAKINVKLALNILLKIGFTKVEAEKMYVNLLKQYQQNLIGKYELISLNK